MALFCLLIAAGLLALIIVPWFFGIRIEFALLLTGTVYHVRVSARASKLGLFRLRLRRAGFIDGALRAAKKRRERGKGRKAQLPARLLAYAVDMSTPERLVLSLTLPGAGDAAGACFASGAIEAAVRATICILGAGGGVCVRPDFSSNGYTLYLAGIVTLESGRLILIAAKDAMKGAIKNVSSDRKHDARDARAAKGNL